MNSSPSVRPTAASASSRAGFRRRSLCLFIAAALAMPVAAQVTVPSSTTTIVLQTLSPGSANFNVPAGTAINTSAGDGIDGNNAQNWRLTNSGAINGAFIGVLLSSATVGGATLDNFSSIRGSRFDGVQLSNGGRVTNHAGASIVGLEDAVFVNGAGSIVENDGSIVTFDNNAASVYFSAGGIFTQSATGTVGTNGGVGVGVVFEGGSFAGSNAGVIYGGSATYALLADSGAPSTFSNSGTLSAGTGALIASNGISLTNTGTITGTGGTAVSFTGSNDTLILGTGSLLNGVVTSTGLNNTLTLQGYGSASNDLMGFNTLNMVGTAWTLNGAVSTTGTTAAATDVQSGTLTITGTLTNGGSGGGISVAPGATLQLGNGGTSGSVTGNIVNNGTLTFFRSDTQYMLTTPISGSGVLRFRGIGVSDQSSYLGNASNSIFNGNVFVESGARLVLNGASSAVGNGITVENGGGLWLSTSATYDSPIAIQGLGWQEGAGLLGALRMADGATASGPITLTDNARIGTFFISDIGTISGAIGDGGNGYALEKAYKGTLILTGNSTYTGGTTISGGTLQIGNGGSSGSVVGNVVDNAALVFNRSDTSIYGGVISGSGSLTQTGSGTTILTGDSSYAGPTTINAGALQLGDGGTTGSITGNVINQGTLSFNHGDDLTYAGAISGAGSVTQSGTGNLKLSGNNIFSGLTTVASGRLSVDGSIAGDARIDAGATLGGVGTVGGAVTIADNGHLAPGDSPGTLHVGALTLNGLSQLDYELGLPNIVGGTTNDLTEVTGNLTLGGRLNVTDLGGFSAGVYRLFDYGGALTNNGMAFGSLPNGFTPGDLLLQTNVAGQVNLVVNAGGFALQFWDGANTSPNGVVNGGTATWNTTSSNWTSAAGTANAPWQNGFAVFEGTAGTVTLGENLAFSGMQFATSGYTVEGNGFSLAAEPNTIIRVDPASVSTINANITDGTAGAAKLIKTDDGLLVLGGTNTYSGGTAINDGVLQVSSDANLGASSGALSFNGGTLATTGSFVSARDVTLNTNGGTFSPVAGTSLTLSGPIGGTGQLSMMGAGTLVLSGTNTYSDGTVMGNGVVRVSSDASLGTSTSALDFEGGTLQLGAAFDPASTRAVTLGVPGGSIDTNGFTSTFAQAIGGAGSLTKLGVGTLILAADNTYGGGTTIAAGTLQLGNGGGSGSVVGNIVDDGNLAFGRSDIASYGDIVSGSGTLSQVGSGTLVLTGNNTYAGITTIASGTLQLGDGGTSGSVAGSVMDNGALVFNRSDDLGFAGVISGTGSLTKLGANTLTFTGNNSYTGTTTITGGVLQIGNGGATGALVGDTVNNGSLIFNLSSNLSYAGAISGTGLVQQQGPGTTVLAGANRYTGGTFINTGTLSVSADNNLGDPSGAVSLNGGTLQLSVSFDSARSLSIGAAGGTIDVADVNAFSGPIAGPGALTKTGTGTLIIDTVAYYTGLTEVAAGTFVVGDSAHAGAELASGGGVDVNAGSFFGGYGLVVGNVDNAGTVGVGNALPALASEPDASFTISGQLINTGVVTMANGSATDQLNVGTYVSSGGQLQLDTVLNAGGATAQSDRLVAGAVTLSGSPTGIVVHNVGGTGAVTQGDGIPLVNVLDASQSAAGAFVLAGRAVAGPYEYELFQGGLANPADGQWYLRSEAEPTPPTPPTPSVLPVPIFRPEVGAYLANREAATDVMMQTLHNRQGDPQYSSDGDTDADSTMGKVWFRAQGGITRTGAADGLVDARGGQSLFQLGGDVGNWNLLDANDRLHVGGMAGYADANADVTAQFNPAQAHGHAYGYFGGAYATWFADNDQRLGSYVDAWVQYGWFDNRVRSDGLPDVHYDSTSWAASMEYGYGFAVWKHWVIEPQAQLIYTDYQADSRTDGSGTRVRSLDGGATIERLGVRVYPQLTADYPVRPFIEANWWHGDGNPQIAFNGIPIADAVPDNRYQLNVGLQGRIGNGWVIWGRFGDEWGSGKYERVDGQIGVKYSW